MRVGEVRVEQASFLFTIPFASHFTSILCESNVRHDVYYLSYKYFQNEGQGCASIFFYGALLWYNRLSRVEGMMMSKNQQLKEGIQLMWLPEAKMTISDKIRISGFFILIREGTLGGLRVRTSPHPGE